MDKKYNVLNESGVLKFPKETKRINELLAEIASINTSLGKNASDSEKKLAWRKMWNRETKIKDIDPVFYKLIHPDDEDIC